MGTPENGGARRDRTVDLLHAMQALSQLSYGPCLEAANCPEPRPYCQRRARRWPLGTSGDDRDVPVAVACAAPEGGDLGEITVPIVGRQHAGESPENPRELRPVVEAHGVCDASNRKAARHQ